MSNVLKLGPATEDSDETSAKACSTTATSTLFSSTGGKKLYWAMRFASLAIPQYATIEAIQFEWWVLTPSTTATEWKGEVFVDLVAKSAVLGIGTADLSSRNLSKATQNLSGALTSPGYNAPTDLLTATGTIGLQALVNLAGWEEGNPVTFILKAIQTPIINIENADGNAEKAAKVTITWSPPIAKNRDLVTPNVINRASTW